MKLVGTRIREENSSVKTEYFPEYCLEWKTSYGKIKQEWYVVQSIHATHGFGSALLSLRNIKDGPRKYSLEWAKKIIDLALEYEEQKQQENLHEDSKQETYIKYP